MSVRLTRRMAGWISALGVHIATSSKNGFPCVIVTESCEVSGSVISIPLTKKQVEQIAGNVLQNPVAALAPACLGAIRAPYQFKGNVKIIDDQLVMDVNEIYCTKPGYEAGMRLDTMSYEEMQEFDEIRWQDISPSET